MSITVKFLKSNLLVFLFIFSNTISMGQVKPSFPKPAGLKNIIIEGELLKRLNRNLDRLEQENYQPQRLFKTEQESGYWPGDTEGRTLLSLTLEWQATGRKPLYLEEILRQWPTKLNKCGYFGSIYPEGTLDEQQLSSHGWVLRGLCEYYLFTKDTAALGYLKRIALNLVLPTKGLHKNYPIDNEKREHAGSYSGNRVTRQSGSWILSTDIGCNFIFLDGVIQAYQVLSDPRLIPVIEEIIDLYMRIDLVKIKAQTHASLTGMRALLRYYEITGEKRLLDTVERRFDLYKKLAMTENYENYNWFGRPEWTEPCGIVDSYMVAVQLWMFTGNPEYLADSHLIYYNALCHVQHADGSFSCSSCSGNQCPMLKVLLEDVYWCCNMRGGEGLARAAEYCYFDSGNVLYIPSYHESRFTWNIPKGGICIKQSTGYPFSGAATFLFESSQYRGKPLSIMLFAPPWGNSFEVSLNGRKLSIITENSFIKIDFVPKAGDKLELTFKQDIRTETPFNSNSIKGFLKYYFGPMLLGTNLSDERFINTAKYPAGPVNKLEFKTQDLNTRLTPVYHLMDPLVSIKDYYIKQVMFKMNEDFK